MSLLDTFGSLLNSSNPPGGGGQQALISTALEFVNSQPGGLQGLVSQFEQGGVGHVIQSWIGNGENLPISPDQLQSVLGSDAIAGLAQKLGMQPDQVGTVLSQVLPHVVNASTPDGQVPAQGQGLDPQAILGSLGGAGGIAGLAASLFGGGNKTT